MTSTQGITTEREIAALCAGIYSELPSIKWNRLELPPDGIAFGLKDFGAVTALIFRGTVTLWDWLHDLEAFADPFEDVRLGPVHPGFFDGLPQLLDRLKPTLTKKPCIVAGHSLGAARASLFTGLMVLDQCPPLRRICFGEPWPGFLQAGNIIATVRGRSYCNGNGRAHDLVTDVPLTTLIEDYASFRSPSHRLSPM